MKKLTLTFLPTPIYTTLYVDNLLVIENFKVWIKNFPKKFFIIYDEELLFYKKLIVSALVEFGHEFEAISLQGGEALKTRKTKENIEDTLFNLGANRDCCLVAIGGGALLDLVGFVAATYCRGVPYLSFPTTLLAMTDASIGGKTAINLPGAKNWIGSLHQPLAIFIDIQFLKLQSQEDFFSGLMESLKHGLIADSTLVDDLETCYTSICKREDAALLSLVEKSCKVKLEIVQKDEREVKLRSLLNYGHTFCHALESLSQYSLRHGEAVALGIAAEGYLSMKLGYLDSASLKRIVDLIKSYLPRLKCPFFTFYELYNAMGRDKKSEAGVPRFVLLEKIGKALFIHEECLFKIDEGAIQEAFLWVQEQFNKESVHEKI